MKAIEDAGYISETAIDGKINTAVNGINNDLQKYILKAEIDQFLTGTKVVAALQTAGFALSSDLDAYVKTETLDNYLKKTDLTVDAIKALGFLTDDKIQEIADAARDAAQEHAHADLEDAIEAYDAQLAQALAALFAQITGENANGDAANETIELPTAAKEAIEALKAAFEANQGVSPAVATEIDVLWIALEGKLTSLVFYPETYYGGIEAIEITALKIDSTYSMKDVSVEGTAEELFEGINYQKIGTRDFDLFPNGYAKYHVNPVNANLDDYKLSFINHTATTRGENAVDLHPVTSRNGKAIESAADFWNDETELLEVEFENSEALYNKINHMSSVPSMAHNMGGTYAEPVYEYFDGEKDYNGEYVDVDAAGSHYVYGLGEDYGKGIVTALVAENPAEEDVNSSYVASDYALIVPVTIKSLVIANTEFPYKNADETSDLNDVEKDYAYSCLAGKKFHLHRLVKERIDDDQYGINKLMYNEPFDLKKLVETHFFNSALAGADQRVDEDLFRRLNLDYRFRNIDYTTEEKTYEEDQEYTHHSLFLQFNETDENGYSDGKGYFTQVRYKNVNGKPVGEQILGEDGKPVVANKGSLGRQPVVRVELFRKDKPELIYAIGYLKLEIAADVTKETEEIEVSANDFLFANCDADSDDDDYDDYVQLTWDQIQTHLNVLKNGEGLSPEEWNTYRVVPGFQGVYDSSLEKVVEIDKPFSATSPYFTLGHLRIIRDNRDTYYGYNDGKWTNVLRWEFESCDYESLYYYIERYHRDWIDASTGAVNVPIRRYFKLHSSDSANPDILVAFEIPAGYIRFPAGTFDFLSYWKDPASNLPDANNPTDLVLNVDQIWKNGTSVKDADDGETNVLNGLFFNKIINSFTGNKLLVDFAPALEGLTDAQKKKALEKWADVKNIYQDQIEDEDEPNVFFFRMPNAKDVNEKLVYENGEWVVNGISGNKYTLTVTDLEPIIDDADQKIGYYAYGSSVSVIKVNGIALDTEDAKEQEELVEALGLTSIADLDEVVDDIQKGAKNSDDPDEIKTVVGIRVMMLYADTSIELLTKLVESDEYGNIKTGATPEENELVKGITQDMLNYASHKAGSNDQTRPYNKQLTAFIKLVADDEALFMSPDCGSFELEEQEGPSTHGGNQCFILPGYGQGTNPDCQYCEGEAIKGQFDEYDGCFRPFVGNTNLTVRFYKPVDITNGGEAKVKDANLKLGSVDIYFADVLTFKDWAGYQPGDAFTNFIKYYGINVQLPVDAAADAATTARQSAQNTVENLKKQIFGTGTDDDPTTWPEADDVFSGKEKSAEDFENAIEKYAEGADDDLDGGAYKEGVALDPYMYWDATNKEVVEVKDEDDLDMEGVLAQTTEPEDYEAISDALAGFSASDLAALKAKEEAVDKAQDAVDNLQPYVWKATNYNGTKGLYSNEDEYEDKTDGGTADEVLAFADDPFYDFNTYPLYEEGDETTLNLNPKLADYGNDATKLDKAKKLLAEYTHNLETWDNYFGVERKFTDRSKLLTADLLPSTVTQSQDRNGDGSAKYTTSGAAPDITYSYSMTDIDDDELYFAGTRKKLAEDNKSFTETDEAVYFVFSDEDDKYVSVDDENNVTRLSTTAAAALEFPSANSAEKQALTAAKKDLDKWYEDNPEFAQFQAYCNDPDKVKAVLNYDLYLTKKGAAGDADFEDDWDDADEDGTNLQKAFIDALVALYNAKVAEAAANNVANQITIMKELCYTDVDITGPASNRPKLSATADIVKLKTIKQVDESMIVNVLPGTDLKDGKKDNRNYTGTFKFTYNNKGYNVNYPFHIYVPLTVTYNYLNEAPAAPVTVYAVITVESTTDNETNARSK